MIKKQAKKQKHKRYESAVGQDPSFTWIKRGWRTSEMQSIQKRGTWGTWCFFTALQWESMGVLQKPCSCSERTGATCVFGNLHVIVTCYHIFTLYAKAPCDHNKKVLPTLKKCQLCCFNTTDTKQRTVWNAHTVQRHLTLRRRNCWLSNRYQQHSGDEMPQLMGISLETGSDMPWTSSEELLLLLTKV